MFIGRTRELAVLEELADSGKPELFVLYGRRRVGKTELLQRLSEGRRAVYFLAAQVREKDSLLRSISAPMYPVSFVRKAAGSKSPSPKAGASSSSRAPTAT